MLTAAAVTGVLKGRALSETVRRHSTAGSGTVKGEVTCDVSRPFVLYQVIRHQHARQQNVETGISEHRSAQRQGIGSSQT